MVEVAEFKDSRRPLIDYLKDPSKSIDRKIQRQAFKYTSLNHDLYHQVIDSLLLKCLNSYKTRIAMGEVHEDIYSTHQSARKMK